VRHLLAALAEALRRPAPRRVGDIDYGGLNILATYAGSLPALPAHPDGQRHPTPHPAGGPHPRPALLARLGTGPAGD